jgi:hypothetical protein
MSAGEPGGEMLPRTGVDGVELQPALPVVEGVAADAVGAEHGQAQGLPPLPLGYEYELVNNSREGHTARNIFRGAVALGTAAIVGLTAVYVVRELGPKTTTQITIEEAQGELDGISLVDRTEFAEAHGHTSTSLDSFTQTRLLHIPFTGININTPKYLSEHAGGTEAGYVDAVLERANAVTLSVGGESEDNFYVKALVDVTGLGIQGVNDFWTADGSQQDGFTTQEFNAVGISSDREDRLNSAETISLNNLEASGAYVLGEPPVVAAGVAGIIRTGILNPSAQLLEKIGPQGAQLLKMMAGRPLYVEFVTYPENAKPVTADKPMVDYATNVLSGSTPVASSKQSVTIQPIGSPSATINFSVRAVTPEDTLLTIDASKQIASIVGAVRQSGNWFVVAVPPKPKEKTAAGASAG